MTDSYSWIIYRKPEHLYQHDDMDHFFAWNHLYWHLCKKWFWLSMHHAWQYLFISSPITTRHFDFYIQNQITFVKDGNMNDFFAKIDQITFYKKNEVAMFCKGVFIFFEACMTMINVSSRFTALQSCLLYTTFKHFRRRRQCGPSLQKKWLDHFCEKRIHIDLAWSWVLCYVGILQVFWNFACTEFCSI